MTDETRPRPRWDDRVIEPMPVTRSYSDDLEPVMAGSAECMRQEMNALFEADAALHGGHRMTLAHLDYVAMQARRIEQYQAAPWAEVMMREALESYHAEAMNRTQRYMRRGGDVVEESIEIRRRQGRR